MKVNNKHKEETKQIQAMMNVLREVAFGYPPLYDFTHTGPSDRKQRKPRGEFNLKQSQIAIGKEYYTYIDGLLEKVIIVSRAPKQPKDRYAKFFVARAGSSHILPKPRTAASLRETDEKKHDGDAKAFLSLDNEEKDEQEAMEVMEAFNR